MANHPPIETGLDQLPDVSEVCLDRALQHTCGLQWPIVPLNLATIVFLEGETTCYRLTCRSLIPLQMKRLYYIIAGWFQVQTVPECFSSSSWQSADQAILWRTQPFNKKQELFKTEKCKYCPSIWHFGDHHAQPQRTLKRSHCHTRHWSGSNQLVDLRRSSPE